MARASWRQLPTENHYETQYAGASVTVFETMFDTYSYMVVTPESSRTAGNAPALEADRGCERETRADWLCEAYS